jgi:uncharacterized protein YciI
MPKAFEYKDKAQQAHFEYLDKLRTSGVTNMFGSPAYLQRRFAMKEDVSYKVFQAWADTFEDRGCPGSDK